MTNKAEDVEELELSEKELVLLEQQLSVLLDDSTQQAILTDVMQQYPKFENAFDAFSDPDTPSKYFGKMLHTAYFHVYNNAFDDIHNAFARHPKHGVSKDEMNALFPIITRHVLQHELIAESTDDTLRRQSANLWRKCNKILVNLCSKAYDTYHIEAISKRKPSNKKLQQNRNRIARSLSAEDIERVINIWKRLVQDNKDKVAELLAVKLQRENSIYSAFHKFGIDVQQQAVVIVDMLDTTINKLNETDSLIPFLQQLGIRHKAMEIKPALLALMKKIIQELIKQILSFNYNNKTRDAWNRCLTFIVGIMINEYTNSRHTRGSAASSVGSISLDSVIADGYDANDVNFLEDAMSEQVIMHCQQTWAFINDDAIIHGAVKVFYTNLINSKEEIKALFGRSDMSQQSVRLVRAIGSTITMLSDLDTLIPILQELGRRHVYYGVKPEHFKYVKRSWFAMLQQALTLQWNKKVQSSWMIVWDYMTYWMKTSLEDALLLYVPPDPIKVNFKVLINHIDQIKLADLSFFADIWFAAYTGDNSSQSYAFGATTGANHGKLDGGGIVPFGGVRCLNAMETEDRYRSLGEPYIRYFEEDDTWYLRSQTIGTFSQLFEVRRYPFDTHEITLSFALGVDDTIAMFNKDQISVRLMPFKLDAMGGTIFHVHEPRIELSEMSAVEGGSSSGKRYTQCKITIPISRQYWWYVYNIIMPLLTIEIMCFAVYFTDLFPIAQRLIISFTLFLTLFSFRREVTETLPPTPYLTTLDHAFNGANLLSVYHVVGICMVRQLQGTLSFAACRNITIGLGAFGFLLLVIINLLLYLRATHYVSLYQRDEENTQDTLRKIAKSSMATRQTTFHSLTTRDAKTDIVQSVDLSFREA